MKHITFKGSLIVDTIRIYQFSITIFFIILNHTFISGIVLILLNDKGALAFILFMKNILFMYIFRFDCLLLPYVLMVKLIC